jgi:hypothetical protein
MKYFITISFLLSFSIICHSQADSTLQLKIIGDKLCINKEKLLLSFSYYYENNTKDNVAILDYYDPCYWEDFNQDSTRSEALVLVIKDDSGKIVLPSSNIDSSYVLDHEKYSIDSSAFHEKYKRQQEKDHQYHTRVLRPDNIFINLYTIRLNKRKCFQAKKFEFDFSRKYFFSLYYLSKEDISQLLNHSLLGHDTQLFKGKLQSNEVELCWK